MATNVIISRQLCKMRNISSLRRNLSNGKIVFAKTTKTPTTTPTPSVGYNVAGLSENVVNVPNEPVGPGAAKNTNYKNPEYFCYHKDSFFEAEVEMAKHRLPQPSIKVYYKPSSQ